MRANKGRVLAGVVALDPVFQKSDTEPKPNLHAKHSDIYL